MSKEHLVHGQSQTAMSTYKMILVYLPISIDI